MKGLFLFGKSHLSWIQWTSLFHNHRNKGAFLQWSVVPLFLLQYYKAVCYNLSLGHTGFAKNIIWQYLLIYNSHSVTYFDFHVWPMISWTLFWDIWMFCFSFISGETSLKLPLICSTTKYPDINITCIFGWCIIYRLYYVQRSI